MLHLRGQIALNLCWASGQDHLPALLLGMFNNCCIALCRPILISFACSGHHN
ncbi:Uncharacterised protein [Vibrio cholerae]|nr:Uncharacterised protein [Vibrio cholerae]